MTLRAFRSLAFALTVATTGQGCISYTVAGGRDRWSSRQLAIAAAIGAGELAVGALGGYAVYNDPQANSDGMSLGGNIASVTGGIVVVDLIIAAVIAGQDK